MFLRKLMTLCLVCFLSCTLFAAIEIRTTVQDINLAQTCDRAGIQFFGVAGDEFAHASEANPVYLHFRLDHNVKLCDTRVQPGGDPIYLPLAAELMSDDTVELTAAPTAVSIVRWVAGEPSIWLKVTDSSSDWLRINGQVSAPHPDQRVQFTLGLSGEEYREHYESDYLDGRANLPFPTKDVTHPEPVGTEYDVDLTQTNLEPMPSPNSLLSFDPLALDASTEGVETEVDYTDILWGQLLAIAFSSDTLIGRAYSQVTPPSSSVDIRTTVTDVFVGGACEQAGLLLAQIRDDAFAPASTENPIYIAMTLDHGATLCRTRVAPGSSPIHLAIAFEETPPRGVTLAAASDAVSVVRWVEGERTIYLKVQQSTSEWIDYQGALGAPSDSFRVRFGLGQTRMESHRLNALKYVQGHANLPANSRLKQFRRRSWMRPASTTMELDLGESDAQIFDFISLDLVALDADTEGVEDETDADDIFWGSLLSIPFSGDTIIARVWDEPAVRDTVKFD
ncbi:hypothetical protein SCOR_24385 [Sulfidibacter corallicola]|uniref:Uncharacterized protein n=1 Tax=Sulfidibacter corallicola TaxID=2818388 RepID=A0A8A4TTU2_SULCO|nr:hypothetical protein [Sulfidibacter corallicola]QTD52452.1 hypothetical protein J3U87_08270 [Sulfidibacter corallicola]